jgi:mycothiol synthase
MDDAEIVAELINACDMALVGQPRFSAAVLCNDWAQPVFNLETDSRLVFAADGVLVGYAVVWDNAPHVRANAPVHVHPDHFGQGIGAALEQWAEARFRESIPKAPAGAQIVLVQEIFDVNTAAKDALVAHGYHLARYDVQMHVTMDAPPEPVVPEGFEIRPFIRGQEERAVVTAIREAFMGHYGYVPAPYEEDVKYWMHYFDTAPDTDPDLWFVAVEGDEVVGTSLCHPVVEEDPQMGWVFALGVRPPWRKRGLGFALLQTSLAGLYRVGKHKAGLSADAENLTGAIRLYEKAGMSVQHQMNIYEKELRPAKV